MRRTIYAGLLVAFFEVFSFATDWNGWESPGRWERHATKISIGFPLPCISYVSLVTKGNLPPWQNYPDRNLWLQGFHFSPVFAILDGLFIIVALLSFEKLLRFQLGSTISAGVALGLLTDVIDRFSRSDSFPRLALFVGIAWAYFALPMAICVVTRQMRGNKLPLTTLAVALLVFFCTSLWDEHRPLQPSLQEVLTLPAYFAVLAIIVFLMRRFIPFLRMDRVSR